MRLNYKTSVIAALLAISTSFTVMAHAGAGTNFSGARHYFQTGTQLVADGQYQQAIEAFQTAYSIQPDQNVLYNIATTYAHLGDYAQAYTYMQQYAEAVPSDTESSNLAARYLLLTRTIRPLTPNASESH